MQVYCNSEVCSRNHGCSENAISIKYCVCVCVCVCVCIYIYIYIYRYIYIQGVTGGTDQTWGGCSLC